MPFVDSAGVQVNFPFEPYPCQVTYMEKVITCLRDGQNGILESPTGTGKTLCLLCSSLAWLETKRAQIGSQRWKLANAEGGGEALNEFKEVLSNQLDTAAGAWDGELSPPKIIFASRTHSQLTQAVQELKRSAYRHFRVCVLGSREQLCIHPQVMKEESNTAKVHMCRAKVQNRSCHFYNQLEAAKGNFANQVLDIEDLVNMGQKHNCCPYYAARELKAEADIIFMPYNYLLDVKSRKAHGVELQGNIVIFDEAHNLEKICEESASFDLRSADIAAAMRELTELSEKVLEWVKDEEMGEGSLNESQTAIGQDFTLKNLLELKAMLSDLEEQIGAVPLPRGSEGITKPGSYIFDIMKKVNLTFETKVGVQEVVEKIVTHLTNETNSGIFNSRGAGLSKFADVIKIVFSREMEDFGAISHHQALVSKHYKVHIRQEEAKKSKKSDGWASAAAPKQGRVLSYWCFSPGHAMEDLRAHGVKSIILTSGTLSPLSSFKTEMGIKFNVELENPHVIESHQVWIGTVGKGPDGTLLNSTYQNRFKESYQSSLGNAIVNFARVVPNGLLIFFPSYGVMDKCLEHWQSCGIWSRIEQYKPVFVEPRYKAEFHTAMLNFYDKINDPTLNGAIFVAVCRGKVSEGLDFSDNNGRAVVITGLPYPPRMDPKVMLKMQFLDEMRSTNKGQGLSGQEWYRQQATRAVNQAIGRVIRHKQDFGAIILCDNRFASTESRNELPVWVRSSVTNYNAFGLAIRDVMNFFKNAEKVMPQPGPPKKHTAAAGGRSGPSAYFMPTMTRTATGAVEKASTIVNHVPSLKPRHARASEEMSLAKLKIEYETSEPVAGVYKPKHGKMSKKTLIDALASGQNTASGTSQEYHLSETQVPSYQKQLRNSQAQSKAKKKIIIKKTSDKSEVSKDSLQSAEAYIAEVKKTLSSDSYRYFSTTLAKYRETEDFLNMVSCLAEIFTSTERNHHLFRRFYRFVRPHHKEQFDRTCKDIIGQGCGFKPEDAIPKKRKTSAATGSGAKEEKRAKLEMHPTKDLPSDTNSNEKSSTNTECVTSSGLQDTTHTPDHAENLKGTETFTSQGSNCPTESKNPNPKSQGEALVETRHSGNIPKPTPGTSSSGHEVSTLLTDSGESSGVIDPSKAKDGLVLPSVEGVEKCDKVPHKENVEIPNNPSTPALGGIVGNVFPRDKAYLLGAKADLGYDCVLCKQVAILPFKAPCNHVCCVACWKTAIKESQSCPSCGGKVKRKHLVQICFGSRQPKQ